MTAFVYTQAEVDQLLAQGVADAVTASKAAAITAAQVQAIAASEAAKALATIPIASSGITTAQVQGIVDAAIAKAVAALPLPIVATTPPATAPNGTIVVHP